MEKVEYLLRQIANCDFCNGTGVQYFWHGDEYNFEDCECNPYGLIVDEDGAIIWDNGLLSESELFSSQESI